MATDLPSGRLVFFFSDVESSTRLLTDLGDRFAPLLGEEQRLIRAAFDAHGGVEVSTEGDSFFAVFRSPLHAVAAAADTQRALAAHAWPPGGEFRVRIGLHLGQAILVGADYVGIDVNRAARIANAANGGQVVVSDETAAAIAGGLPGGLALVDLGRHRLKDIGVERLWRLDIEGLAPRSGALRSLEAHPSNLPAEVTSLVDREAESIALQTALAEHALVTVTGAGGIGKSRLAIHVARALVADFPDGVFYLDLAPIDRVETVLTELAILLGVRMPPSGEVTDPIIESLRDRRVLLVLETADRNPGIATFVASAIERCPTTRLLVTGRAPLHLRAEHELSLQPLGLPPPGAGLASAAGSPAIELFVRRARAVNPGFGLTEANVTAVSEIVRRLDGLPLAVELAAAATRLLSPAAILTRLERSLPLPGGAAVDAPVRQRTMRDTIEWSARLLDPTERAMLGRLSVFAGDMDLDGVTAVAMDDGGADTGDGLEVLGRLVDRSLVHRVDADDDRYRLLGPIREFAAAELAAAGDADTIRSRHATYWLTVAVRETARLDGADELPALAALERARDEFRSALEWAIGVDRTDHLALRIANALGRAWYLRGRVHEGASWLERALAADPDAPREIRAQALHWLGVMFDEQRDDTRAIERLEEALAIEREIGDERAIARELNSLGAVHRNIGDHDPAEALLTESLMRRRRMGDVAGIATVLTNLGILAIDRGRPEEAIGMLEEALEIDRASGATGGVAYSSSALGAALLRDGRRDEALRLLASGLGAFHELDDADGIAEGLERLAEAGLPDDPARAARLLLSARSIRERERLGLRSIDQAHVDALFASVAAALTDDELAAARADAGAMDADAAVAYALAGATV